MNNKISFSERSGMGQPEYAAVPCVRSAALPDLSGVRLACCMHLDMKMIPLVQGILDKGRSGLFNHL
ncbi:adenosylhomocysteinase [Klebsiella pneumoniae]|uniref:Adenosylhomocysteinase n=1 Tax=Klebsiella pneumoniae TaxID=573 RepID=A0A3S4HP75_KLEPN|nr:adenosylhomocysteinase [Klebsiella pneumoniae]